MKAVALSLVVLTAYSLLFAPAPPPPAASPGPVSAPVAAAIASPVVPAEAPSVPASPAVSDERERRVEVQAPDYTVAFTNRGARPVSWTLARFRDGQGAPEEMVPAQGAGLRPLDVETGDPAIDARLREALYQPSSETLSVSGREPQTLRFSWSDGELAAEKTLEFRETGLVGVTVSVSSHSSTRMFHGQEHVKRVDRWLSDIGGGTVISAAGQANGEATSASTSACACTRRAARSRR